MRDEVLVQAQTQLDEIAAAMARALSDRTINGTAVAPVPQAGFDIDLSNLIDGNSVRVTYTDNLSGQQRTLTLMRVDDPDALPLSDSATTDPNDQVIGIDFSGGMASVVSQLSAALGSSGLQFSNPGGNTLRILDDGLTNKVNVDAASATYTVTSLTGGACRNCRSLSTAMRALPARSMRWARRRSALPDALRSMPDPGLRPVAARRVPDHAVDGIRRCDAPEFPLRPA